MLSNQSRAHRRSQESRRGRCFAPALAGSTLVLERRVLLSDTTVVVATIPPPIMPPADPAPANPADIAPPVAPTANPPQAAVVVVALGPDGAPVTSASPLSSTATPNPAPNAAIQPSTTTSTSSTQIWTGTGTYYTLDTTTTSTTSANGTISTTTTITNEGSDPVYSITITYPPGQTTPTITEMLAWSPNTGSPYTMTTTQLASTFSWSLNMTVARPGLPNYPNGYSITTTSDCSLDASGNYYSTDITMTQVLDSQGKVVFTNTYINPFFLENRPGY